MESDSARNGHVVLLDPSRVKPFDQNPRHRFRGIPALAESIRSAGQAVPILVAEPRSPQWDAELIDGERRLRACLHGGMKVRASFQDMAAEDRYVTSIAANMCSQRHDAVEIMEAVENLHAAGKTYAEVASIFGKTLTWVVQYRSLAKLDPLLIEQLKLPDDSDGNLRRRLRCGGRLTLSVALLLVAFPHDVQREMYERIRAGDMSMSHARTFCKRFAEGRGISVGKRQSPASQFAALATAIETCKHVVDRYVDLPGAKIGPIIQAASRNERHAMSSAIEALCESLLMMGDALRKV